MGLKTSNFFLLGSSVSRSFTFPISLSSTTSENKRRIIYLFIHNVYVKQTKVCSSNFSMNLLRSICHSLSSTRLFDHIFRSLAARLMLLRNLIENYLRNMSETQRIS